MMAPIEDPAPELGAEERELTSDVWEATSWGTKSGSEHTDIFVSTGVETNKYTVSLSGNTSTNYKGNITCLCWERE